MSRPQKPKRVCGEPLIKKFLPDDNKGKWDMVTMSLDEYETIRLIDLEGISREECAARMNIARTTAQDIYNSARVKLATCIVQGKELHIEGGSVFECDGSAGCKGCSK